MCHVRDAGRSHENRKEVSRVEERDQAEGGGEGKGQHWGMKVAKFYCYVMCMYKYVTMNSIITYN